jgi:hypothetical protein
VERRVGGMWGVECSEVGFVLRDRRRHPLRLRVKGRGIRRQATAMRSARITWSSFYPSIRCKRISGRIAL